MWYEDDEQFGYVTEEVFINGNNRKNFLNSAKSYILYYWKFIQDHNLLGYYLAKLSDATKIDLEHVPSTTGTTPTKVRGTDDSDEKKFRDQVASSFSELMRN